MRVVVVGAGVVGMCCALALRREGADVAVLDRAVVDHGASIVNAGWVTPVLSAPLGGPGVLLEVARATARGDRYVGVRPAGGLVRWTSGFLRSCGRRQHREGLRAMVAFGARAVEQFGELRASGVGFEMHRRGLLIATRTEHGLAEAVALVETARSAGYAGAIEIHTGSAARRLEPALSDEVVGAVHAEADAHVRPETLLVGLRAALRAEGVEIRGGVEVRGIERGSAGWTVATAAGPVPADRVVIAAGVPTSGLLRGLGVHVPLLGGKGYSVTARGVGTAPVHPVKLLEATIACSPFDDGLRMSGMFVLGGRDEDVRNTAVTAIQRGATRYLRDWRPTEVGVRLAGLRPCTPDSLPVIGAVPGSDGVFVAAGHGTLGLTLAPATAAALVPLVLHGGHVPGLAPFAVERFAARSRIPVMHG